jgi:excisionase family DNA binding protein
VLRNGITLCIQEADDDSGESARSPNGTDAPVGGTNDVGSVNGAVHKNGAQWDDVDLAAMTATSIAMDAADAARWRALPNALRLLAHLAAEANGANGLSGASGEADGRRDDRTLLIERILNPMLSLEDAARLIGVHPGTIRRWANKGTLPHQRTVGQQRRFHLADVLAAMERREHEDSTTGAPEQAP